MFVTAADSGKRPPALQGLPRPIFGFAGNITDQRLDFDAIKAVADAFPEATIVLMGPLDEPVRGLARMPQNVVCVEPQKYEDVPVFLAQFDVGIVPYLATEFNLGSSPLKVHEYLAVGLPVVGTALPSVEEYGDLAAIGRSPAEFARLAGVLVETRRDPSLIERRRAAAKANGVDRIAETVGRIIDDLF